MQSLTDDKIVHEEENKLNISNAYQALKRENYFYNSGVILNICGFKTTSQNSRY